MIKLVPMPPGPETVAANTAGHDAILSELLTEHRCLAEVMYYEARGEGEEGEKAVAEVVFHRMAAGDYGKSICAVVYEGTDQVACRFSFACDGSQKKGKSEQAWRAAQLLAARVLTGEVMLRDETGGAVNYHAVYVRPRWARDLTRTAQIGNHIF
ncbi:MAG: cell wall hydrolase [Tumebacillaceae bacterium]